MKNHIQEEAPDASEAPPFLQSWNQLYALVLILHALVIFLFYWFTHAYA
ncbi:MAG: hypothetical protein R2795_02590 [Saprospiraceae bacterium]